MSGGTHPQDRTVLTMNTNARRRSLALVCLLPLMFLLSGCIKMSMSIDIKSESDIQAAISMGVKKSDAATLNVSSADSLCSELKSSGSSTSTDQKLKYTPKDDGDYYTCEMSGQTSLADMKQNLSHENGVWTFHLTGSELNSSINSSSASGLDEFKVSVTFPGKVLSHNGSSMVSGRTVTWTKAEDLTSAEGLKATGSDTGGGGMPVWAWVLIGLGALALIGAAVFFLVIAPKQKKAKADAAAAQNAYPGQQFPGQQYPGQPYPGQYDPQSQAAQPQSGQPQYPGVNQPQGQGTTQYPGADQAQGYPQQNQGWGPQDGQAPQAPQQNQGWTPQQGQAPQQSQGWGPQDGQAPQALQQNQGWTPQQGQAPQQNPWAPQQGQTPGQNQWPDSGTPTNEAPRE